MRYRCETCQNDYARKDGLVRHIKKAHLKVENTLEKKFACPTCHKLFYKQFQVNTHVRRVHNKKYSCCIPVTLLKLQYPNCKHTYAKLSQLMFHISTQHTVPNNTLIAKLIFINSINNSLNIETSDSSHAELPQQSTDADFLNNNVNQKPLSELYKSQINIQMKKISNLILQNLVSCSDQSQAIALPTTCQQSPLLNKKGSQQQHYSTNNRLAYCYFGSCSNAVFSTRRSWYSHILKHLTATNGILNASTEFNDQLMSTHRTVAIDTSSINRAYKCSKCNLVTSSSRDIADHDCKFQSS